MVPPLAGPCASRATLPRPGDGRGRRDRGNSGESPRQRERSTLHPVTEPLLHNRDGQPIERVLAVMAHPDDIDFGAGGTIAALTAAGVHVSYCIITSGDAGGVDRDVPRSEIPAIRQAEQRAAGAALGVADIAFLGYRDGELSVSHELRRDISRVIRQVRPDRMFIQSPDRNWDRIQASHPDHLAAGKELGERAEGFPVGGIVEGGDDDHSIGHPRVLCCDVWLGRHPRTFPTPRRTRPELVP